MYDAGVQTRRYFLALAVIALTSVASFGVLQVLIHSQYGDAKVLNHAGRQRMLSQRVGLYASLGAQNSMVLSFATKQLGAVNEILLDPINSPALGLLTRQEIANYAPLKQKVRDFIELAHSKPKANRIASESSRLLLYLDEFTKHCEEAATSRIRLFERVELCIFLLTLFILFVEATFIFWPLTSKLKASFKAEIEARQQAEAKEALAQLVINNIDEALVLTDSRGFELGVCSAAFKNWFPGLSEGGKLQSILPEVDNTHDGIFEVYRGCYHFKGRILKFVDTQGTARQLILIKDDTLAKNQAELDQAQARRLIKICNTDRDLATSIRSDVIELIGQLEKRPPNDTVPLELLLGALAGLGFESLNQLCRRVLKRASLGENNTELKNYLIDEVERYIKIIESEIQQDVS